MKKSKKISSQKIALTPLKKNAIHYAEGLIIKHINLEKKVRQQTDELETTKEQIKEGINRERLSVKRERFAQEQLFIRNKAIESTVDGIFIIDAKSLDFPIIYANPSFYSVTGYTKNEVIGKNYFELYGLGTDTRITEEIKKTLVEGKSFHGEMLNFHKSGEKFWTLLRITPVRDTQGFSTHYIGIKTDITLMKKRDLEIEEQREELLHVTRVGKLAEFVSSLAHEISQPLTAIRAYAQAAKRILVLSSMTVKEKDLQVQDILQYIINDEQRATEVIGRLRLLLKKTQPAFEDLDINSLIQDTSKLMMTYIVTRNKGIKFELDQRLPHIQGDRIQLQQVLLNLISNSIEAMEESTTFSSVVVKTSLKDDKTVIVEVIDTGTGISPESMKHLFTHFYTTKKNGLGMGLPISRSIIEAHGGLLNAVNNTAEGATFSFTLPVYHQDIHG